MAKKQFLRQEIDLSGEWSLTWSKPNLKINSLSDLKSKCPEWIPANVPGEIHFDILGEKKAERLFNSYLVAGDSYEIFDHYCPTVN